MCAFPSIHELEAIILVVGLKTEYVDQHPYRYTIRMLVDTRYIDQNSSPSALESRRTSGPTLGACACEIWPLSGLRSFTNSVRHKPGAKLLLANTRGANQPSAVHSSNARGASLFHVVEHRTRSCPFRFTLP